LVNILYPESTALPSSKVPDVVAFNQPTTDDLTPQLLIKAIREAVLELFGDYGSGAIAGSLMGEICHPIAQVHAHSNSEQLNIYRLPLQRSLYELRERITGLHGRPCR
jgi:ribonuclease P/MRP protein subunit POP5